MARRKKNVSWAALTKEDVPERFDYYLRDGQESLDDAFRWMDIYPKRKGLNGYIEAYGALRTASALWEFMPSDPVRLEKMQNFENLLDSLEEQLVNMGLMTKR